MIFSRPTTISKKKNIFNGQTQTELTFEGIVRIGSVVEEIDMAKLLDGLQYCDKKISCEGIQYFAEIVGRNLVIKSIDGDVDDAAYIKDHILSKFNSSSYSLSLDDLAKKIIVATKGRELLQSVVDSTLKPFEKEEKTLSQENWAKIKNEINDSFDKKLDNISELYIKYFSQSELLQLLAFYESSIGKKVIEVTPNITHESMNIAQQWSIELVQSINREIQENKS